MTEYAPREAATVTEEIADLSRVLASFPLALTQTEAGRAYQHRLQELRSEFHEALLLQADLGGTTIDARFDRLRGLNALPASFIGRFLHAWQALFDSLGQAATGRITRAGSIAREITDQTRLLVQPFVSGSFVVRMAIDHESVPQVENLGRIAFDLFERLVEAGDGQRQLSLELTQLRSRVASNYAKLLQLLVEQQVDLDISLAVDTHKRSVRRARITSRLAGLTLPALQAAANAAREEVVIEAKLNMANARTGAFELDLGDEGTISGRAGSQAVSFDGLQIGAIYRFFLLKIVTKSTTTGDYSDEYVLSQVEPRN